MDKDKKPENEVTEEKKEETTEKPSDDKQSSEVVTSARVRKPVQRLEMAAPPVKTKEKIQIPKVNLFLYYYLFNVMQQKIT